MKYIKRSTKEAEEHMKKMKTPCWIETHRRLKWRVASNKIKTRRAIGRPKRRWEDDINEFLKTRRDKGKRKA